MRFREFAQPLFELTDAARTTAIQNFKKKYQQENPGTELASEYINSVLDKWKKYLNSMQPREVRVQFSDILAVSKNPDITWKQFEDAVLDAEATAKLGNYRGQTDPADLEPIYDHNNLVIYRGDSKPKCIHYGQGYTWCISRKDSSNLFYNYRYGESEPMFYFVFDRDRDRESVWHAVVIHVSRDGKFTVTTSSNQQDQPISWNELVSYHPKLEQARAVFKPQPLSDRDRKEYDQFSKPMSQEQWDNLTVREKIKAIEFGTVLSDEQQELLPYPLLKLYLAYNPLELSRGSWLRLKPGDFKHALRRHIRDDNDIRMTRHIPEYDDPDLTPAQQKVLVNVFATDLRLFDSYVGTVHLLPLHDVADGRSNTGRRWLAAESEMSSSAVSAIVYASFLGGRWPEPHRDTAEKNIAQNPETAFEYAEFLGGRWPEPHRDTAEAIIAKDPQFALYYARVLGGRWPEPYRDTVEKNLAQNPSRAYGYAQLLGGRWPEPYRDTAEASMAKFRLTAVRYAQLLGSRWPEPHRDTAEKNMAENRYTAFQYAQLLGSRWPEPYRDTAERNIYQDSFQKEMYSRLTSNNTKD